ncbi:hypothetical protein PG991_006013 [Apiospora marii]|uniref:non-specific serine/threonine protein kinase n=1 Tax=Apiospora marii TaxID=335849 RepID=A0ABR1SAT8_9PEZI
MNLLWTSSGLKPDNPFPIYVANHGDEGRDGNGTTQSYVSSSALREYWDIDAIDMYVHSVHRHVVDTERIQKYYIKWWDIFYEAQWQFCPVEFSAEKGLPRHVLDRKQILPIRAAKPLTGGQNEVVTSSKVTVDRNCIQLLGQGNCCVFKEYTERGYASYKNEVEAYTNLARHNSQAIIRCYEWFEQAGKYTIILEYAELGSLIDYWEFTHEPTLPKDIDTLWTCFFELLRGLAVIHSNLPRTRELEGLKMFGMHSDIKPGNILVSKKADSSNPYDVYFKIADFGLSRTRPVIAGNPDPIDIDSGGSRMYNPPETTRRAEWVDSLAIQVGQPLDIWGMGCVFSEMASWMVGGPPERMRYRLLRKEKTTKKLEDAGYSACFHDGEAPLPLVKEYHITTLLQSYRIGDSKSFQVGQMVFKHMLLKDPKGRLTAEQLYARVENLDEEYPPLDVAHSSNSLRPDTFTYPSHSINASHSRTPSREIGDRSSISPSQSLPWADGGTPLTPVSNRSNYQGLNHYSSPTLEDRAYPHNVSEFSPSPHQPPALDCTYSPPRTAQDHATPTKRAQRQLSRNLMNGLETQFPETYPHSIPGVNYQTPERTNTVSSRPGYDRYNVDASREESTTDYHGSGMPIQKLGNSPIRRDTQTLGRSSTQLTQREGSRVKELNRQKTEELEKIDYITILKWISEEKKILSSIRGPSKANSMDAPSRQRLESAKATLGKRELIFIIDDSIDMRVHWGHVLGLFKALHYLVKPLDEDGVDVYFTSDPNTSFKKRPWRLAGKSIEEKIEKRELVPEPCPMEKCLSERFREIKTIIDKDGAKARPTSLFILSNGKWSPNDADDACGVAILVRDLVKKLASSGMDRFQVSLQFVRFNSNTDNTNKDGTQRLAHLDNGIVKKYKLEYDIVDQKQFEADVCSILTGPLDRSSDENDDVYPVTP